MSNRYIAWGGYVWGGSRPGLTLDDLERARAKAAAAASPTPSTAPQPTEQPTPSPADHGSNGGDPHLAPAEPAVVAVPAAPAAPEVPATDPAPRKIDYRAQYTVKQLAALCRERGLTVTPTGKGRRAVEADYVRALEAADAAEVA